MGKQKILQGTVISDKMQNTIVVRIMRMAKHPKYKRIVRRYTKFKVHDEKSQAKLGDLVKIQETRPISKEKRFRLLEIIKKAAHADLQAKVDIQ